MFDVGVTTNVKDVIRSLNDLEKKQLPYAYSKAANETAEEVRKDIYRALGRFILRKSWFQKGMKFGLNIKFASKRKLEAIIYMRAPGLKEHWMEKHITGKDKTAKGSGHLAVPTKNVRPNTQALITKAKKPAELLRRGVSLGSKGAFVAKINGTEGIYKRQTKKGSPRLMYALKTSVKIDKEFPFYQIAEKSLLRNFKKKFDKWLAIALRTAK